MNDNNGINNDNNNSNFNNEINIGSGLSKLFTDFFESEKTGGFLLIAATLFSILAANIFIGESYSAFWYKYIDLSFFGLELKYSIQHWINDALIAVFFLMIGLEIERELYTGELSSLKKAALPVVAALGGMIFPAAIHYAFNYSTPSQSGIGIPMATDIAFAIGVLSIIGRGVPASLKIFLTAFAIIDDIGAILMIAIFYSGGISTAYLLSSFAVFIFLLVLNRMRVFNLAIYLFVGFFMWYFMLKSGIHATIAGILLAFAIPFQAGVSGSASDRLLHALHKPVAFIVLPLFALANTAIIIDYQNLSGLLSSNSLGIILGLFIGKPLGVFVFSSAAVRANICSLPHDLSWSHILGAGFLGGIGFTMSIFISNLAFDDAALTQGSILAIIAGSLLAAIAGVLFFNLLKRRSKSNDIGYSCLN